MQKAEQTFFFVCKKHCSANSNESTKTTSGLQYVHSWRDKDDKRAHAPLSQGRPATACSSLFNNDPSAGSPTETLLRLLLPLNDQV